MRGDLPQEPGTVESKKSALIELDQATECFFWEIEELSEPERVFRCARELVQINNGGFDQYYFNTSGDLAHYTPTALRTIGAVKTAAIIEEANRVFPGGYPSSDRETRVAVLDELSDATLERLDELERQYFSQREDPDVLLFDFVRAHRDSISGADRIAGLGSPG